ncbi:hypothetical protein TcCL_Unassigned00707, partial [Trypanosoma cruzi]
MDDKTGNAFSKTSCQEAAGPREGRKATAAATAGKATKRLAGTFTSTRTPHPSGPGAQTEPLGNTRIKSAKQSRSESTGTPRPKQIYKVAFFKGESAFTTTARTPRRNFLQISLRRSAGKRSGIKRERND